jgi:hypothetical protein
MDNQEENHPNTQRNKQITSSISILPDLSKEQY